MKDLGSRLTEFRKAKGLSQETLAEDAGISLLTLQRIEKEGTNPHGDTLKRLAESLDVSMDELLDHSLEINYNYIRGMHYSALTFIILPLGNIILPMILWVLKKDKIKELSVYARNLLNWQVTWTILVFITMMLIMPKMLSMRIGSDNFISLDSLLLYPFVMTVINFIYTLVAGIFVSERYRNLFPLAIRFLK
ncbi:MAG TPA: helix-turn-helix domain-containing protein [Bacteroidales bacterium]|nr:helix-turn-helix domain-containing protein [Bacteroidales bacterium]